MTEDAGPGGIAARLIDRAQGRITALRPQQPRFFAAEQARDAPLIERTEDVPADAPMVSTPSRPVAAAPPQPLPITEAAADSDRLMAPRDADRRAAPSLAGQPLPTEPMAIDPQTSVAAGEAASPSRPAIAATAAVIPMQPAQHPDTGDQPTRDTSLSAAITQLLGATESEAPRRDAERHAAPAPFGPDHRTSLATPAERRQSEATGDKPEPALSIHIGEIVIAPEPGAPLRAERPAPAAWQPPVALADYRAARASERR